MKCNRLGKLSQPWPVMVVTTTILILCFSFSSVRVHSFIPPLRGHAVTPPRWKLLQFDATASSQMAVDSNELTNEANMARFRGYLNWIAKNTRGWHQAAMAMDDELRAMEEQWNAGQRRTSPPTLKGRYHGSTIRPDATCYGIVAEAFAKADLGRLGAEKASEVLRRCHDTHNGAVSVVLHTTVMKAWANAGDFVKARQLLLDMEGRYAASRDEAMAPDMIAYTIYLNVLSDSKAISGQEIASEALALLKEMHTKAESGENVKVRPNTYAYTAVMKCLARANDYVGIENLFQDLRRLSEDASEENQSAYRPGKLVYGTMIGIYAESDLGDEGARKADVLLNELQLLHRETGNILYRPNPFILSSVLTAYAKVHSSAMLETALARTDEILAQCQQDEHLSSDISILEAAMKVKAHRLRFNGGNDAEILLRGTPEPSANMFQIAIFAHAVRQNPTRAQKLLDEMTFLARTRKMRYPSTSTIVSCIKSWTKRGGEKSLEQAGRLIRRILKQEVQGHQKFPFDLESRLFNDLIVGWRRTGIRVAGEKSEDILNLLYDAYQKSENIAFLPTNYTYHSTIEAWGNSSHPDSGQRALRLLQKMEAIPESAGGRIEAGNAVLYAAMKSLVRTGNATLIGATNDVYTRMCENYLLGDRSFTLTPKTNTMFLRDFVSNADPLAGVRAENLLRHMDGMSKRQGLEHLRPSHFEYTCVMNVYAKKGLIEEAERILQEMESAFEGGDTYIEVTATTYSVLILALVERARPADAGRIRLLLKKVLDGHRCGIKSMKPDDAFFTSYLFVLAQRKSKDASLVDEGFHLLREKRQAGLLPSDMDYGILCKLILNHGNVEDIDRLVRMLTESEAQSQRGREKPLRQSVYVQAMTTCMYHEDATAKRKGMEIMQHIEHQVASGRSMLQLDRHLYHVLLSGWARSHDKDAFLMTIEVFKKMESSKNPDVKPITRSYNWVIFAAGQTPSAGEAEARSKFETAMALFTEMHKCDSLRPDALTYSNFLFVCATHLPQGDGRDKVARNVVDLCQKNGLMSSLVYENLSRYFPLVLRAVEESEGVKTGVIPKHWQRNVPPERTWNNIEKSNDSDW